MAYLKAIWLCIRFAAFLLKKAGLNENCLQDLPNSLAWKAISRGRQKKRLFPLNRGKTGFSFEYLLNENPEEDY